MKLKDDLISAVCLVLFLLMLCMWVDSADAQTTQGATREFQSQTLSVSGNTLTFNDQLGTQANTWDIVVTGAPATCTATITGFGKGGNSTVLATPSCLANITIYTSGGPYDHFTASATWTGGASPTVSFSRDATVARGQGGPLNPSTVGRSNPGDNPFCYVNGTSMPNIAACISALNTLTGNAQSGTIYSNIPEDFTTQPFSGGFSGVLYLNFGTGSGNCGQTAPFHCWTTEVPLIIPSGLQIRGTGLAQAVTVNKGAPITFGVNFPTKLGAPAVPVYTCAASGGALSNGNYIVSLTEINNAMTGTLNPKTPMYSRHVAQVVNCANGGAAQKITFTMPAQLTSTPSSYNPIDLGVYTTLAGGQQTAVTTSSSGKIMTFNSSSATWGAGFTAGTEIIVSGCSNPNYNSSTNPLGTNTWFVVDGGGFQSTMTAWNPTAPGAGATGCVVTDISVPFQNIGSFGGVPADSDMVCPGVVGTLDNNGCLGTGQWGSGTVTILQVSDMSIAGGCVPVSPQQTSDCKTRLDVPQGLADLSNPMILYDRAAAGQFDTDLRDITLDGSPTTDGSNTGQTPLANEPDVLWLNYNGQEQCGQNNVTYMGAAGTAFMYAWGGPIHLVGVNIGSGAGPNANTPFFGLIADANRYNIGGAARIITDSSFNPHTNGGATTPQNPATVFVTGNDGGQGGNGIGVTIALMGAHHETGVAPTNALLLANNANAVIMNSGWSGASGSALHIGLNAGSMCVMGVRGPPAAITVKDDETGLQFVTSGGRAMNWCTDLNVGTFNTFGPFNYYTAGGTATALTISNASVSLFYNLQAGTMVNVKITAASTGAATLAAFGGSAIAINKPTAAGLVAIASGDFQIGMIVPMVYNGTVWVVTGAAVVP